MTAHAEQVFDVPLANVGAVWLFVCDGVVFVFIGQIGLGFGSNVLEGAPVDVGHLCDEVFAWACGRADVSVGAVLLRSPGASVPSGPFGEVDGDVWGWDRNLEVAEDTYGV
jgi:hypothetical protein